MPDALLGVSEQLLALPEQGLGLRQLGLELLQLSHAPSAAMRRASLIRRLPNGLLLTLNSPRHGS
jgi:hypothetical protein